MKNLSNITPISNKKNPDGLKNISKFIKFMMDKAEVTPKVAAECIGCTVGTFRNKMTQDRFSLQDLILVSELCDYHLALVPDNQNFPTELLTVDSYVSPEDKAVMKEYRKKRLQKHLDILETYMHGMSIEEKQKFISEHLPNMINGTETIEPKK